MICKYWIIIVGLILTIPIHSQNCVDGRYLNQVFDGFESDMGVPYGSYSNNEETENLLMDIYEPMDDTASKRPLIIWCHGGGFMGGTRNGFASHAKNNAKYGYVSASIDYRLNINFAFEDSISKFRTVLNATHDLRAAIRFFKEDAATNNYYRIDTNYIFIGGASAGAVTALHVAYMDLIEEMPPYMQDIINETGGIEGNSGNAGHISTDIAGVIGLAGGLYNTNFLLNGAQPPSLLIHGTLDAVVPYEEGSSFGVTLYGSKRIQEVSILNGISCTFYSLNLLGHNAPKYHPETDNRYYDFMHNIICSPLVTNINYDVYHNPFKMYPNPADDYVYFSDKIKYSIQNMTGKVLREGLSNEVSLQGISTGIYVMAVEGSGYRSKKLLMVK